MSEKKTFTPYEKLVIALLALTQFSVVLDFMVMSPLGDFLMKAMEISPQKFGLAVSAYAFSAGLSGLLAAGFADSYDRKNLLLFFYVGFIVGTFLCGIAPTYQMLLAARIITGIFGGVIGSISLAIVTDLFDLSKRGRVMGFVQMGFGASQVLGIPIGLYLANIWGWHAPFLMIVGLASLTALLIFFKLLPVREHLSKIKERSAFRHLLHTMSVGDHQIAFGTTALLSIGGFLLMPFGSAFLVNNVHISPTQLPIIFMATGVFSLISMPLVGRLADKVDKFRLFAFGSVWAAFWMLVYTNLSVTPIWLVIIINILLFIGIVSRIVPSMALISAIPSAQDRGAFMSINSSLQQIAGGIAAAFAGLIVKQSATGSPLEHYNWLGYIGATIICACIFMMREVSRRNKAKAPGTPVDLGLVEV